MNITPVSLSKQKFERSSVCDRCCRTPDRCICGKTPSFDTRLKVVILQHPQEQFKVMNSARLCHLMLNNSRLFVGLSWSNFKKVAGPDENPSEWGILYLSPGKSNPQKPLQIINRKKHPMENHDFLKGIIALDGSWKQSKTLWWRNPWLLRLNRIHLNPDHPSLRPQVKEVGLSTIEAVAFALRNLGEKEEIPAALIASYDALIIRGTETAD